MQELSTKYEAQEIEKKWYQYWLEKKFFHSEINDKEPFTIVIPPPNVTGILHMGHMLNNTIQDILVRRARQEGKNACWVPGTDHASIATEAKVVNKLAQEGIKKTDLSREDFLKHAWEWTDKHGGIILEQLKKLGCSCDWDRTCFTLDKKRSDSVIKVFCDLYDKGLIYRGVRMVNWDPKALTAISDEEVIYKEQHGKLYYLKYKVVEESKSNTNDTFAIVATTRPETIMGDTAMCINPNNPKTKWLKGKKVIVPIINREIPVIEDEYVDMEFGTGCLKVTPAHDVNDYMLGEKYNLESIDIFNDDGTLNENGQMYKSMDRFDCRKQILKDIEAANLLEKIEDYNNKVGFSERTDVPIEPKLSMQWFLKMSDLAIPAMDSVENDTIKFYPPKFKNTYRHWMENIKDWNISRQLWWGHQIPAWFLPKGGFVVAENINAAFEKAKQTVDYPITIEDLRQDDGCLDTWFSSWLWPISVFDGINNPDNPEINYYYPTNDLITAPDIIFFWVARMIMSGYEYRKKECFTNVYFTGIVRDKLGRKMSKQLGNSPDPIELMDKYGADGVRMGLMLSASAGNDILFDEALCEQGRNFNNKIWNAFRLVKSWNVDKKLETPIYNKIAVDYFGNQLSKTIETVNDHFTKYRINDALMAIYKLFWDEFSAWYLEIIKPAYQQSIDSFTFDKTLEFFEVLLKLLHPFMPFITEELFQAITKREENESIMFSEISNRDPYSPSIISDFETVKEIIAGVRTIRLQKNIPLKDSLTLYVKGDYNNKYDSVIKKISNISEIIITDNKPSNTANYFVSTTEFYVPITIDKEEELAKLKAELKYSEGFLKSVSAKLSNEKFVNNAPADVVTNERKKQSDAEAKIRMIKEQIENLS